jgi:thiamine-phosphate pyrophosphorylase
MNISSQGLTPLQSLHLSDMLRCAITDRTLFPGRESERQSALIRQAAHWAQQGINLIQLREKDLPVEALTRLAHEIKQALQSSDTCLLINSSLQAAIDSHAHGVHLTSNPGHLTPAHIRQRYAEADLPEPIITVSCHTLDQVAHACIANPSAILFSPVFGKTVSGQLVTASAGLDMLKSACRSAFPIPVYALGGINQGRAVLCQKAGAAGVAGIRLFHNGLAEP